MHVSPSYTRASVTQGGVLDVGCDALSHWRDRAVHCPPLPQAMSIKNKGVQRVGVPSIQDLQKWAEQSQSSEDYKHLTLETFEAALQWLAERRVNVKWKPLSYQVMQKLNLFASAANKCEPSSSTFERRAEGSTKPISAYKFNSEATQSTPATICGRRNSICRLHRSGWQVTRYAYFEEKENTKIPFLAPR